MNKFLPTFSKICFCLIAVLLIVMPANAQQNASPNIEQAVPPDSLLADSLLNDAGISPDTLSPDTVLAARIERAFASLSGFASVQVEVYDGVVKLSGKVVDASKQEQAAELAMSFPEAIYIVNDLQTDVEIEARITPAINRIQSYMNDLVAYLPVLGIALLVLLLFTQIARFVDKLLPSVQRMGVSPMAGQLIIRLFRAFFWLIGLVLALDILGITALVGAVLGAAGLMGIAIGFAFKDIIENYLAGLLLSARHPFKLNDHVMIGSEEGKVVRLTSRELVLMTLDGNHVRIPNGIVFKNTLYNYSHNPRRRFSFSAGIDVEEDLQRAQKIGTDALRSMRSVLQSPAPFCLVKELGDFNVILTFYGWVDQTQADFSKSRSEAIRLVKNALDEAGVLMPEPIYNVRMKTVTKDDGGALKDAAPSTHLQTEGDISVDDDIEQQIEEDLRGSNEANLLDEVEAKIT